MKSTEPLKITKKHRIQIYNLAVKQIKSLQASTFLINQDKNIGASANSEQIRKSLEIFYQNDLKANPKSKIQSIILTGVDNLSLFQRKIKRGEVIAIVENRPNQTSLSLKKWLKSPKVKGYQQNVIAVFDTKAPFQISSTQLRRMFHTSKSYSDLEQVKKYFQPAVFEYHIKHKLVYPVSQQAKDVYTFDVKEILAGIKFNQIDYKSLQPLQQNSDNNDEENKLNTDFSKGQLLGQGLSAKVRLMYLNSVGKRVAVKLFLMNNSRGKKISIFKREMKAFGAINGHQNIIYCYGAGQKQQQYLFIVLQIGINVNSLKFCQQLYYSQCKSNYKQYLRKILPGIVQLSKGLQYMSEKGVLHRDLQSDNIIAFKKFTKQTTEEESKSTNYTFKILDFGVSAFEGSEDAGARGSLKYYSPEAAQDKINYTTKSDVFSFGLLIYELLMLQVIWKEIKRVGPILQRHAKGIRPQFEHKQIPDEIKKLVQMTWHNEAKDRIQFGEFAQSLQEIINVIDQF